MVKSKVYLLATLLAPALANVAYATTTSSIDRPLAKPDPAKAPRHPRPRKSVSASNAEVRLRSSIMQSMLVEAKRTAPAAERGLSKSQMAQYISGTNPLKMVGQLPGVSFSATDPLGIDIWGASIYVRGFSMGQLGVTLDGIPLNDQYYEAVNGLNIVSAVISNNLERTEMSEGAGNVGLPSTNNLGGTIAYETSDPASKPGGQLSQTFGSYNSFQTYARLDSGVLDPTGTRLFVSYSRTNEHQWIGGGDQSLQQAETKIVQPIGTESSVKLFFNWSHLAEWEYQDNSLGILRTLGWRVAPYYPDYALAYQVANGTVVPRGYDHVPGISADSVSLFDAGQAETDYLGGLNFDLALTDRLRWLTTVYGHGQIGDYTFADPSDPPPNGAAFSEEVDQDNQERRGVDTRLIYERGSNRLDGGVWYENADQNATLFFYTEPLLGQGQPVPTVGPYTAYGPAFMQGYGFRWITNTVQTHLMDTWRISPTLTAGVGFKSLFGTTAGGAYYNNSNFTGASTIPNGTLSMGEAFLPHVSLVWQFRPAQQLYLDVAENARTYQAAAYGISNSLYSAPDQATFLDLKPHIQPETVWAYVVGYRYSSPGLSAGIIGYHSDDTHQLLAAAVGTLNDPISQIIDLGRISTNGVNADATIRPVPGLSIYNSVGYADSLYERNVATVGGFYQLAGKHVVNYPPFMYKGSVAFTRAGATIHLDASYYSRRYFSLTNDTSVPGYWLANLGFNYSFPRQSVLHGIKLSLDLENLLNAKYISMMGENGNPMAGDYQSLERGSIRQYFGTVSAEF